MIEIALDSLNFYFFKLSKELEELQTATSPTEGYLYLTKELSKFNHKIYENFIELIKDKESLFKKKGKKYQLFSKEYKDFEIYVSYISVFKKAITYLKNTTNIITNPGINILINYFINKIDSNTKFIIYPDFKLYCSYMNFSKLLKEFPPSLRGHDIVDLPVFFLPSLNKDEIYFTSTITHEIGHYIEEKFDIYGKLKESLAKNIYENENIKNIILKKFAEEKALDPIANQDFLFEELKTEIIKVWISRLSKWIKEIISDIIGLKIVGLPFFFGFIKTFLTIRSDAFGSKDHPPPWLRFNYLYNEIKKNILLDITNFTLKWKIKTNEEKELNFEYLIKNDLNMFKEYFQEVKSDQQILKYKTELEIIESIDVNSQINPLLNNILDKCNISEYEYENENKEEIFDLIKLVINYITPNEIIDIEKKNSKPANILNILNASWLFYIYLIDIHYEIFNISKHDFEETPLIQQKLSNLILKAIELSHIHNYTKEKYNQEKINNN